MFLNLQEIQAANKRRELIQKYFFHNVRMCNGCAGTGLGNFITSGEDHSWDGHSYCDKCKGIGYLSWEETLLKKLCPTCNGGGNQKGTNKKCSSCEGEGVVDWIKYMRIGKQKKE